MSLESILESSFEIMSQEIVSSLLSLTEGSTEQPKTAKQKKLYTIRFWIETKQHRKEGEIATVNFNLKETNSIFCSISSG